MQTNLHGKFVVQRTRLSIIGLRSLLGLSLGLLLFAMPSLALAQSTQMPGATAAQGNQPAAPATDSLAAQQSNQQSSATLSGTIVDQTGAAVPGAQVTLTREDQSPKQE